MAYGIAYRDHFCKAIHKEASLLNKTCKRKTKRKKIMVTVNRKFHRKVRLCERLTVVQEHTETD